MPILCLAEIEYGVLENQDRTESGTGFGSSHQASRYGVARHPVLGMSAQAEGEGGESARLALHAEQNHALELSAEALSVRRTADDYSGGK